MVTRHSKCIMNILKYLFKPNNQYISFAEKAIFVIGILYLLLMFIALKNIPRLKVEY